MKKLLKWMGAAVLVPVVLVSSVAGLLYFPPFQRWAVKQASAYASEKTGMDVQVGNVRLRFPLDLEMNEVSVVQRDSVSGAPSDTLAHVGSIVADVKLKPLLKKQVVVDELTLEDAKLNTGDKRTDKGINSHARKLGLHFQVPIFCFTHPHADMARACSHGTILSVLCLMVRHISVLRG